MKTIAVGAKELRLNLTHYLDLLERGEEITIIRNSVIIGRLVPSDTMKRMADAEKSRNPGHPYEIANNKQVKFRRFGPYEDPAPLVRLHREALIKAGVFVDDPQLDADLSAPSGYYDNMQGELWVGEMKGEIVAMGAFRMLLDGNTEAQIAELKRMRVRPDLQGKGIGGHMIKLLEDRAKRRDYVGIRLDASSEQAQKFYESHGYTELERDNSGSVELVYYQKSL